MISETNEKLLEFVKMNGTIVPTSYKFWDHKMEDMYDIFSIEYDEGNVPKRMVVRSSPQNVVKEIGDGILIPSTTLFDRKTDEIYLGDIVECNFLDTTYKNRVVFWDNGWRVIGATTEEFQMYCDKFATKIGNIWESISLYEIYLKNVESHLK